MAQGAVSMRPCLAFEESFSRASGMEHACLSHKHGHRIESRTSPACGPEGVGEEPSQYKRSLKALGLEGIVFVHTRATRSGGGS